MLAEKELGIRYVDLPALIRLAEEIGGLGSNLQGKRLHVLSELAQLCSADKGVVVEFKQNHRTGEWIAARDTAQFINTPVVEQQRIVHFLTTNDPIDPMLEHITRQASRVMVIRPVDFLGERAWRACPHYAAICKPSNIREKVYAFTHSGGVACGLTLHRRESRPFSKRELRIIETFLSGAGSSLLGTVLMRAKQKNHVHAHNGMAGGGMSGSSLASTLPPRLKSVLERFLLGESEKEAAQCIGVTYHTVHSYAKQLYRRLGVSSRSELLARFIPQPKGLHLAASDERRDL